MNVFLEANQRQSVKSTHQDTRKGKRYPFVEITSDGPGSGKTHLLYYITAVAILPSHINGVSLHGKNSAVIFIDADLKFDVCRLFEVIRSYIVHCFAVNKVACIGDTSAHQDQISSIDLDEVVGSVLQHVHVVQQQSFEKLLESLRELPCYLLENSNHSSEGRRLHAILVDGISAFYWESRMGGNSDSCAFFNAGTSAMSSPFKELVRLLHTLQASFACIIVVTTWSYKQLNPVPAGTSGLPNRRPILLSLWPNLPKVCIVTQRGFQGNLQLLSRDWKYGETVTSNHLTMQGNYSDTNYSAWLDESSSVDWDDQVLEALKQIRGFLRFSFMITGRGIKFEI